MKIHLLIDNERYPLTIRREDELLYRNSAKQISMKDKNNTEPYQEKLKELTKEIEQYLSKNG